eukprot:TRINITY_DN3368_c0_g1_i2.p1 TRINITY_DN3368_c0_g1~~TRINITY_DN3368_c0_g1_i2.p1  ORF type:complete len:848 (+),score=184.70 TRINITY_DN3368_c0_g1_i2:100-2544(+)
MDFSIKAKEFASGHFSGEDVASVEKEAANLTIMRDQLLSTPPDKVTKEAILQYYGTALNFFKHLPGGAGLPVFQYTDVTGLHPATGSVTSPVLELASLLFNIAVSNINKANSLFPTEPKEGSSLLREASSIFALIKERHTLEGSIDLRSDVLHCLSDYYMAFLFLAAYRQTDPSNLNMRQRLAGEISGQLREVIDAHNIALDSMHPRFKEIAVFYIEYFKAQHWQHVAESLEIEANGNLSTDMISNLKANLGPVVVKLKDLDDECRQIPMPREQKATFEKLVNELLTRIIATHTSLSSQLSTFKARKKPAENWVMSTLKAQLTNLARPEFEIPDQADPLAGLPPAAAGVELRQYEAGVASFLSLTKANTAAASADISNRFAHLPVAGILSREATEGEPHLPKAVGEKVSTLRSGTDSPSASLSASLETLKSLSVTCRNLVAESEAAYAAAAKEDADGFARFGARWKVNRENFIDLQGSKDFLSAVVDYKKRLDQAASIDAGYEKQITELDTEILDRTVADHEEQLKSTQTNVVLQKDAVMAMVESLKAHSTTIETGIEQMNNKIFELETNINNESGSLMEQLLQQTGGEAAYHQLLSSKMEQHKQVETEIEAIKLSLEHELTEVDQICNDIKANDPSYDEDKKAEYIQKVDQTLSGYFNIKANLEKAAAFYPTTVDSCNNMKTWINDHILAQCFKERASLLGLENSRSVQERTDFAYASTLSQNEPVRSYEMRSSDTNPYYQASAPPSYAPPSLSAPRYLSGQKVCTTLTLGGASQEATVVSGSHDNYALRLSATGEIVTGIPASCVYPAAMEM